MLLAMLRARAIGYWGVMILLLSCLTGCFQGSDNTHVDEQQDPHYQRGRTLVTSQDFKGAAQEFEKALETNPDSAAAHFELAWLCDTKLNDSAAAIYHYQRYLELQPASDRGELVRERIRGCKQELANSEFPLPDGRNLQKQVDDLTAANAAMKQQMDALKAQLYAAQTALAQAQARPETVRYVSVPQPEPAHYATAPEPEPARVETSPVERSDESEPSRPHTHTHVVKPHETIRSIAAEYGMKASALLAANPEINPRRLRIGQSLVLP
jgi:LysM repeat protein